MERRGFGERLPNVAYWERTGAYGVALDADGYAAVVHSARKGYFLLGGGLEPGESDEACIRREALEETGLAVKVKELICVGDEYISADLSGRPFHPIGRVYLLELGAKIAEPTEPDHRLVWLPVSQCEEKMYVKYQAWAVKTAWEHHKKKGK